MSRSPLNWYGGKFYIAKKIIPYIPEHDIYVEGFGGAAHFLFLKQRSKNEIYNDINSELVNFFRVVRDNCEELETKLQLTPYSREEFGDCLIPNPEDDEVERARKFFTKTIQSVNAIGKSWATAKISRRGMSHRTSFYLTKIDEVLPKAVERMREVVIENLDFEKLIPKYDGPDTFFYLDPPYVPESRVAKDVYEIEMDIEKHQKLLKMLQQIEGKFILSGYEHQLYEKYGWTKIHLGSFGKHSSNKFQHKRGDEYIWINYELNHKSHKIQEFLEDIDG